MPGFNPGMSWQQAVREAERWLLAAGVPAGKIKGQYFDLRQHVESLPEKTGFRIMVLRAARRELEKRGASFWLPDPPE